MTKGLKIFTDDIYQRNRSGERAVGVVLVVKRGIRHHNIDDVEHEIIAMKVETSRGTAVIAIAYLPPRRPILHYPDILTPQIMQTYVHYRRFKRKTQNVQPQ